MIFASKLKTAPYKYMMILSIVVVIHLLLPSKAFTTRQVDEYALKAAFVANFIRFIQWPKTTFSDSKQNYKLCYIGDETVKSHFSALNGKTIGDIQISVSRQSSHHNCNDCDIVFFSRTTANTDIKRILASLKDRAVLTIGESNDFIQFGGIIRFVLKKSKLHFQINHKKKKKKVLK